MKQAGLTFFLLLLAIVGRAVEPEALLRGRVYDLASGAGLPGANLLLKKEQGTVSGENGMFEMKVSPGQFTLKCQYVGYRPESRTLRAVAGDTLFLDFGLVAESAEIEQVVVSANRIEQRVSELTVSMTILKPEGISARHITDPQELVNKTPGIEVLDGQASVRGGSGFSYGAGSRVLALVDGLPVLSADAGNIKWQFLPLENLAQVEIIKGASSVAYGSSALNGVLNFRTADASARPETRFHLESSLYGKPANKDWVWWSSPRMYHTASFSHLQRVGNNDLSIGSFIQQDDGYRRLNDETLGRVNFRFKHRDAGMEGLSYGVSLLAGAARKTDFVLWENSLTGALRQDESTATEMRGTFLALDPFLSWRTGDNRKHDLKTRLQFTDNSHPETENNNSRGYTFYGEYQFFSRMGSRISLITGASASAGRVLSQLYDNHASLNAGVFAQAEISLAEAFRFVSGLRFEYNVLDGKNDRLVPLFRAGVNYRAGRFTHLRASFGQGYRFPSIAEKHAATTLGSVRIFPSPDIRPESGWNSEAGIQQGLRAGPFRGQLDAALFLSQNKDMIEFLFGIHADAGDDQFGYGFKAANREASRVYGLEIGFLLTGNTGQLRNTFSGGYVYMVPQEINPVTGKPTGMMLKYRRRHAASLNLETSWNRWDAGVSLWLRSKILEIDDVFLAPATRETILPGFFDYWNSHRTGYFLADLSAGCRITGKLRLSAVVKNATNSEYMGRPGDIQPQRSYSLRVGASF